MTDKFIDDTLLKIIIVMWLVAMGCYIIAYALTWGVLFWILATV